MNCDPELSFRGATAYSSFGVTVAQDVALESPVIFNTQNNVFGLALQTNNYQVKVPQDGVYVVVFLCESTKSSQFAIFTNNTVESTSIVGINKGANQMYIHQNMPFKKGDLISVVNHSSNAGTVTLSETAGGVLQGTNALLLIYRIAPLPCATNQLTHQICELPRKVKEFKHFLEHDHELFIAGSDCYFSVYNTDGDTVQTGKPIFFDIHGPMLNAEWKSGEETITVCKDGIYKFFIDVTSYGPTQTTVYVNGIPLQTTTQGTDSCSGEASMRQLAALHKGDKLTLVNWQSLTPIALTINAGGNAVGINANFCGIKIANLPCK